MPDYSINILWEPVEIPGVQIPCCRVRGFEMRYAIACNGDMWSSFVNKQWNNGWHKLNQPNPMPAGHLRRPLDGKGTLIHHLVIEAFREEWPGGDIECRHLDGDPGNNWWWNLQWGTRQENADDRVLHGNSCRCEASPRAVLTRDMVIDARLSKAAGETIESIAARLNKSRSTVYHAVAGLSWAEITDPPPIPSPKRKPFPVAVRNAVVDMLSQGYSSQHVASSCSVPISYVYSQKFRIK